MIWPLLGLLFVAGMVLVLIGRLWGNEGIFLSVMLGLAALDILLFGGAASIAFSLRLPLAGWLLTLVMIVQLVHIGWQTLRGLQ